MTEEVGATALPTVHPEAHPAAARTRHPWSTPAFGLAAVVVVIVVLAAGTFAAAYAIGGQEATSDNWVGVVTVVGLVGGLLSSVGAFAPAVGARLAHERTWLTWLPLLLFPTLLLLLVLGEAFWWE